MIPLVFALTNPEGRIVVDAVLLDEDDVSQVFSFTRSYFHVGVAQPYETVRFLKSILPVKPLAELYIAIGHNKHGKTELYRDLLRHLASSDEPFVIAPGDEGMVMLVFTMPSRDNVFKMIKDRFAYPKTASRQDVLDRYRLVFRHDRAGRLVDAQEFEHLEFERSRFSDRLLEKLVSQAAGSVTVEGDRVAIRHLYIERRLAPLNLYLASAPEAQARAAVLEFGQAIKDLAATNVFPGDLLPKNFGVTRHGRVVFYDYDELCPLDAVPLPRPARVGRRARPGRRGLVLRRRERRLPRGVRALPRPPGGAAAGLPRGSRRPAHPRLLDRHAAPDPGRRFSRLLPLPAGPPARRRRRLIEDPLRTRRSARVRRGRGKGFPFSLAGNPTV